MKTKKYLKHRYKSPSPRTVEKDPEKKGYLVKIANYLTSDPEAVKAGVAIIKKTLDAWNPSSIPVFEKFVFDFVSDWYCCEHLAKPDLDHLDLDMLYDTDVSDILGEFFNKQLESFEEDIAEHIWIITITTRRSTYWIAGNQVNLSCAERSYGEKQLAEYAALNDDELQKKNILAYAAIDQDGNMLDYHVVRGPDILDYTRKALIGHLDEKIEEVLAEIKKDREKDL